MWRCLSSRRLVLRAALTALVFVAPLALRGAEHEVAVSLPRSASCQDPLTTLYQRISPAVVLITATSINPYGGGDRTERQAGSGVLIDEAGLIVTNSHVVFGQQVVTVTLDDGTTLPARIVGADPVFDVAVIRIPQPQEGKLPTAELGESEDLLPGEEVFAIGNPFGLEQTLTRGVLSAVNRILPGASMSMREPMIQTDAAINHGSSGGPLVDRCGKVIGINMAILPDAQSIGFAIPVDLVKKIVPDLVEKGRVVRPWLGVQGQLIPRSLSDLIRLPLPDGFMVEAVEPGSPASRMGIRGGDLDVVISGTPFLLGGDVITAINGMPVGDPDRMIEQLDAMKVGETIQLALSRGKESRTVDVVLAERPALPQDFWARRAVAPVANVPRPAVPVRTARQAI